MKTECENSGESSSSSITCITEEVASTTPPAPPFPSIVSSESNGMKRQDIDESCSLVTSPPKRSRFQEMEGEMELRLLISSHDAGSLIGQGGSNITRLRQEYDAKIEIPECQGGPERLLKIVANEDVVHSILDEVMMTQIENDTNKNCEIRLLFSNDVMGGIIGKRGAKIQQLRSSTTTRIKVYPECCPKSVDRIISVSGSIADVQLAARQILGMRNEQESNSSIFQSEADQYDPHNFSLENSGNYGGYDGKTHAPNSGSGRHGSRPRVSGSRNGRQLQGGWYGERDLEGNRSQLRSRQTSSHVAGGPLLEYREDHDEPIESTQYTIPNEFVGALIGHRGVRIRQTRQECGAGIEISEFGMGGAPGGDRVITVTGTAAQIKYAAYLLQQSVKSQLPSGRFE